MPRACILFLSLQMVFCLSPSGIAEENTDPFDLTTLNIPALRRAAADIIQMAPEKAGPINECLQSLTRLESQIDKITAALTQNDPQARQQAQQLLQLQRQILLSNPILDQYDEIILIKRKQEGNLALPANWESNSSLNPYGWDNEIVLISLKNPDQPLRTLFKPAAAECLTDIDLHFNADKIMFSMPGANQRWQIFELNLTTHDLEQLPLIIEPDVDNYDSCYLPDGNIIFSSTAPFIGVPCVQGASHVTNLYHFNRTTGAIRRLTFDQEHNWCPTVMPNGQVLYLRWEYTDTPHFTTRILFTMNPDGTNQREFYGSNSYWPNSIFYARPIPNQENAFIGIVTGHHGVARIGELVLFDTARGRREAEGALQRIPGYGQKIEPVIVDRLVDNSWPKFLHPCPLNEKYVLVAAQLTPQSQWGLYLVDIFDNILLLRSQPGYVLFEPVPLIKTPIPPIIPSRVDPGQTTATMYITDIYRGDGLKEVPRGTVKKLRLFTYQFAYHGMGGQVNRVGLDGPWDVKRIIGTVPVEADGSAMFSVPANTPISMQPLDQQGKAIALMRSWATAMPGEILSCVGCHEPQNSTPVTGPTIAAGQPPATTKPWYGPTRGFSFNREVQPVLDKYCVGCHGAENCEYPDNPDFTCRPPVQVKAANQTYVQGTQFPPAYLALRQFVRTPTIESDSHLLDPYEFHASNTELIQILQQGHHNVTLDAESWDRLVTWIDLNTPAHGSWREVVGPDKVNHQYQRRLAMMKKYSSRDDDEEFINPQPRNIVFQQPAPAQINQTRTPACSGWPLTPQQARQSQQESSPAPLSLPLNDSLAIEMAWIPAGEFIMGAPSARTDTPPRKAQIESGFWMTKFEITNRQFACFDPQHDSRLENGDFLQFSPRERGYPLNQPDQPVCRVSWQQATKFCQWLSSKTGRSCSLPNEIQWEYACRAGSGQTHWFGDSNTNFAPFANLADKKLRFMETIDWGLPAGAIPLWRPAVETVDDGFRVSAPVGSYQPNPWGLFDMLGNVAEWTDTPAPADPYEPYEPSPDSTESYRIVRGGSWYDRPGRATASSRQKYHPWQKVYNVGFRIICTN